MILAFESFEKPIDLQPGRVTTLEINNRKLFARIVQSLIGGAEEKLEPYTLWVDESEISPTAAFYYLSNPFRLPYKDSKFEGLLLAKMQNELRRDVKSSMELESLLGKVEKMILQQSLAMNAEYSFAVSFDVSKILKSLEFSVDDDAGIALLDNLICFMGFVRDIGFEKWVVVTNLKSFFDKNELKTLFDQAYFYGFSCLLLESYHDSESYNHEMKYQVDDEFIESW